MTSPSHHKNEVNSSMSVDELQEVRNIWDELNLVFSDGRIVTLNEQQEREYRAFIHQYVTKKQIEERNTIAYILNSAVNADVDNELEASDVVSIFEDYQRKQLEIKEER